FVQKPERMMAILMIMTLCLLVYSALEYVTRTLLKKKNLSFENQVGKLVQNPSMKWIFECFEGIHVLYMYDKQSAVLNLKERHRLIINLLGERYLKYYT
ncbi:MAG: IS1634 family transposase, partial [Chitinophagales bacterium]